MLNADVGELYNRVAHHYALRIEAIFESEETLKAAYEEHFTALPFDRTERWNIILMRELRQVWKEYGPANAGLVTIADGDHILHLLAKKLDFNLFTQVLLNLQPMTLIQYRSGDAQADIAALEAKWKGLSPSPFDAKPKMIKSAATPTDLAFNRDLSTVKALKIVSGITTTKSFRVSPMGSTPALTDSENLSMLGIGGDQYLKPQQGHKAYYICWDQAQNLLEDVDGRPNEFTVRGIRYPFVSKSGGEILNSVLFARLVATTAFRAFPPETLTAVLPRMNSVLVVTGASDVELEQVASMLHQRFPGLWLHAGARPDPELAPATA
jgi:hypothetical protein